MTTDFGLNSCLLKKDKSLSLPVLARGRGKHNIFFLHLTRSKMQLGLCRCVVQVKTRHTDWKMLISARQVWVWPVKPEEEFQRLYHGASEN